MPTDNREPWEVEYCLRFNYACTFLDMMQSTGLRRAMLCTAYSVVEGDWEQWCQERIIGLLDKCETLVKQHGRLSIDALGVVQSCAERLRGMEWCGNARLQAAGIWKID